MQIIETFSLAPEKAIRLFWTPGYVKLSKEVWDNYNRSGELSELYRHVSNCASRWGISRRCAEAILSGEAQYNLDENAVTVTRPVTEE